MSKPFPLDIYSIKKIGLDNWQNNFYWPVTTEEYKKIENNIHFAFNKIQSICDNKTKDSLWVLYPSILISFSLLIHNKLILDRISNNEILFDDLHLKKGKVSISNFFWDIFLHNKKIKFPSLESYFYAKLDIKIKRKLVSIKNNLLKLKFLETSSKWIKDGDLFTVEPISYDMIDFAEENNQPIFTIDPYKLKKPRYFNLIDKKISNIVKTLVKEAIKNYQTLFTKEQLIDIEASLSEQIQFIININEQNMKLYERNRSNSFLAMRLGNPLIRSVGIACMRNGIKSYGFSHGNYIGFLPEKKFSNIFFGCVNNFIAPTKTSALFFSRSAEIFNNTYNKNVKIQYIKKNTSFRKIKKNVQKISKPLVIEKVLLVEFGLGFDHQSWPFYLDFTLNIGKALKNNPGLITILKRRPERIKESEGVYENYFDKCIHQPFEDVYDQADLLIFPRITTTTFGFALFTNLPIIVFEHSLNQIYNDIKVDLFQRCNVIPSWLTPKSKIEFDEEALLKVLKGNFTPSTPDYIKKYYLG